METSGGVEPPTSQVITLGALSLSYEAMWGGKDSNLPRRPYRTPAP